MIDRPDNRGGGGEGWVAERALGDKSRSSLPLTHSVTQGKSLQSLWV